MKTNKGFSLVELIIVVAILAIIVGTLAPQYIKYVERSKIAADENSAEILLGIAYTMITDQEVCDQLKNGDSIEFGTTGIKPSNLTAMQSALDEHLPDWTTVKVRSHKYKNGYTISFATSASDIFWVKGEWN